MHLASMVDGEWNNRFLCTMMPDIITCLRRDLAQVKPDFLLITGDIASQHSRDAVFAARDLLDSLEIPYYPMGGNHDFVVENSRKWFIEAYVARLPKKETYYSFTHKGLHICALDPWWKWRDDSLCPLSEKSVENTVEVSTRGARWALPPHQLSWLEQDLTEHAKLPTIIALHCPLVPIPKRMHRPGFKDAGHLDNAPLALEIIRKHPNVKAVFAGHVHMHFIEQNDGLTHVTTGSMPEYPCEFREIIVNEHKMDVVTHKLSDSMFAERSLIPGKEWTKGEPQDRQVSITL
jgi:3',5'-cyclic AMP phosphodiesterase CpdA